MTIRLSAMFEEHMGRLLYNWKCAKRRETNALKKTARGSRRKKKLKYVSLKDLDSESESGMNGKAEAEPPKPGPSTRLNGASPAKTPRKQLNNVHKGMSDSNDEDDYDDDRDTTYNPRTSRSRKNISNNEQENSSGGKDATYNPRSRPKKKNVSHDDEESNDDGEEGDDNDDKDYNPKTKRGTKNILNYVGDHNDSKDTTYNPRTRRKGRNTNNNDDEADEGEEYYDDYKDTTYNPRSGGRKKTPSKRNYVSNPLRSVNKSSDTSDSDSSSSDNDRLLDVQRKLLQQNKRNIVRKRIDSPDTSESDENIRTSTRTRMIKRPRYIEDSNSEISDVDQRQNDDDTEDGSPCISISSRGRVRKITERARALFNRR